MFFSLLSMEEIYPYYQIIRIHYMGVNLQALNDIPESNENAMRLLNAKNGKRQNEKKY